MSRRHCRLAICKWVGWVWQIQYHTTRSKHLFWYWGEVPCLVMSAWLKDNKDSTEVINNEEMTWIRCWPWYTCTRDIRFLLRWPCCYRDYSRVKIQRERERERELPRLSIASCECRMHSPPRSETSTLLILRRPYAPMLNWFCSWLMMMSYRCLITCIVTVNVNEARHVITRLWHTCPSLY